MRASGSTILLGELLDGAGGGAPVTVDGLPVLVADVDPHGVNLLVGLLPGEAMVCGGCETGLTTDEAFRDLNDDQHWCWSCVKVLNVNLDCGGCGRPTTSQDRLIDDDQAWHSRCWLKEEISSGLLVVALAEDA